jgi:hypothetical protein
LQILAIPFEKENLILRPPNPDILTSNSMLAMPMSESDGLQADFVMFHAICGIVSHQHCSSKSQAANHQSSASEYIRSRMTRSRERSISETTSCPSGRRDWRQLRLAVLITPSPDRGVRRPAYPLPQQAAFFQTWQSPHI